MPSALLASVHVRLADLAETLLSPALLLPSEHRAVAMHHLSGFYVDSGDLSRGSHANTANVLSAGALSRAPFFLCLKKNVSSGDQTQVLGIARPALLLSSLASSWSLVFTLRMVLNTTQ